jgi:sulfonate transport system substrate-binding protein
MQSNRLIQRYWGSRGWTSPIEILDDAGVPLDAPKQPGAVRFTNIMNAIATTNALLSGRIEATSTHIATADNAPLWTSGQVKAIGHGPDNGVYVNDGGRISYFAMREFGEQHPRTIQAFLLARERTIDHAVLLSEPHPLRWKQGFEGN